MKLYVLLARTIADAAVARAHAIEPKRAGAPPVRDGALSPTRTELAVIGGGLETRF